MTKSNGLAHDVLPDILGERLAIVGGTGSGKSYTARGLVERVLVAGGRVGIIDPTGVWYGLRWKPDGKGAGLPVVMFGGDHSDMPLNETAGRLIAQAVATTSQSWVIDTSALKSKAAERRFMLDFLDAIFEANRDKLTLVVDEADRFSPQRMNPESARLHERMEEIVRRGRVRGFVPWLITQRPASLNKDVLSQASAMISMQLTGSHDRKALAEVIEGQADKEEAKRIIGTMPNHQTGQGLVWVPRKHILEAVSFPRIVTFDSMKAPEPGERQNAKPLPPIDLGALREKLATVETEAKANDPKVLKAEIARLKREAVKPASAAPAPSRETLTAEYERGYAAGVSWAFDTIIARDKDTTSRLRHLSGELDALARAVEIPFKKPPAPKVAMTAVARPAVSRPTPAPRAPSRPVEHDGSLTGPQRHLLRALAWWAAMGHDEPRRPQIAAIAGWVPSGSNLKDRLSELKKVGLVDYPRDGYVRMTPAGVAVAPEPDRSATMVDGIRKVLTGPQRVLFDNLLELGGHADRVTLAERVGWEPTGSNLKDRLSELRRLEVVDYPSSGVVQTSDWLGATP